MSMIATRSHPGSDSCPVCHDENMEQDPSEAFWDARYGASAPVWSGQPNPLLVESVQELPPGRALDAGSGEGADAIWLACQGWTVHAVDFSSVALNRAGSHAELAGVSDRVTWMHQNIARWVPPAASYDLVSTQFLHLAPPVREQVFRNLAAAVAPGGMLLIVGHHPTDLNTGVKRPSREDLLFTPESVAEALDSRDWEQVICEVRPRRVQTADGNAVTVHDSLVRACRPRSEEESSAAR